MDTLNLPRFPARRKSGNISQPLSKHPHHFKTYLRYGLWLLLVVTANANRRHFGLTTTWLPHFLGNSLSLLLPEIYSFADWWLPLKDWLQTDRRPSLVALHQSFEEIVQDNPNYVDYVAPAALAYIVSHPHFNIYRGRWGEMELLGFGLDSIPHSTTAYALSTVGYDTIETVDRHAPADAAIHSYVRWMANHKTLVVGAVMAGLTIAYETSEYVIHKSELKARNNDINQINMMWSVKDTVFDVLSNILGWLAAVWRHR